MPKVLIVGQGLAGTSIGRKLEGKGADIRVISSAKIESASSVAAGVWNPVVVRRFIPAWRAEESLIACRSFYQQEESLLGEDFFFTLPLHKVYSNEEEKGQFIHAFAEGKIDVFCDENTVENLPEGVKLTNGALKIKESGYLDVQNFLLKERERWSELNMFTDEKFIYDDLIQKEQAWEYHGDSYDSIVFCDGIGAKENPFIPKIPLLKVKGETINAKLPKLNSTIALNKALFVLPLKNGEYKIGATYDRDAISSETTEKAREELLSDLAKFIDTEGAEVTEQKAGFRPAVLDRRPLIGQLPQYPNMYMLNGLGSRGVMLAPLMAEELSELILNGTEPDKEAQLQRFTKKLNL